MSVLHTQTKSGEKIDFAVGGQAVIEGVMMRSPNHFTISVRDTQGKIQMKQAQHKSLISRVKILGTPLVRGLIHLFESMAIGIKALNYSSDVFMAEEEQEDEEPTKWKAALWALFSFVSIIGSFAFTLFLLKFVPLWVAERFASWFPFIDEHYMLFNMVDGVTKLLLFVGYLSLISLMNDIKRVFQYHGAEHKSIFAYEKGLDLTVENAKKQTRFHPRCGTSFIFLVIIMSILVYTVIPPADEFWGKLLQRVAVIPLIAGLSYELLKFSAKHQTKALVKMMSQPGLWIQRITTREPDDEQLEVALHALKHSLDAEKKPSEAIL